MVTIYQIQESAAFLQSKGVASPKAGIILGTGLNELVQHIKEAISIPYSAIPGFPPTTIEFHKGQFIFGFLEGVPVVVMQGRLHYYEGYTMQQITFPVRVMNELGIHTLLVSNAAGGINLAFKKGDLVITEDHLNFLPDNPLRGSGADFGNRFTDMSCPYAINLQHLLKQAFENEGLPVKKGTYAAVMGPNLETRAEYRFLRNSGADMVGMSTVPEVIVAVQSGISCAAVSVITDECDPENLQPVNIAEIIEVAAIADRKLTCVFRQVIQFI